MSFFKRKRGKDGPRHTAYRGRTGYVVWDHQRDRRVGNYTSQEQADREATRRNNGRR